jgi:hypothetical protein
MGGRVGRFNHSEKFMANMVKSMHQVVIDGINNYLKSTHRATTRKAQVFAATADKVTEQHRTGQAVGVLLFDQGESAFVDYILAKDGTCKGLADELIKGCLLGTLRLTRKELAQQLVGFAADGQYFANNLAEEIAKHLLLEADQNDLEVVKRMMEWLLCTWDAAHRLELTIGDVRKDKMCVARQMSQSSDSQRQQRSRDGPQEASPDSLRRSGRERRLTERARSALDGNAGSGLTPHVVAREASPHAGDGDGLP